MIEAIADQNNGHYNQGHSYKFGLRGRGYSSCNRRLQKVDRPYTVSPVSTSLGIKAAQDKQFNARLFNVRKLTHHFRGKGLNTFRQ